MSIIAIIVAAIINMAIGAVWYSPILFAKPWMKAMGFDQKAMDASMKKGMQQKYAMMFVASLVLAFIMHWFMSATNTTTFVAGMAIGLFAWLGFTTTSQFANWVFSGRPKESYFIDTGYQLVSYLVIGGILAMWK